MNLLPLLTRLDALQAELTELTFLPGSLTVRSGLVAENLRRSLHWLEQAIEEGNRQVREQIDHLEDPAVAPVAGDLP